MRTILLLLCINIFTTIPAMGNTDEEFPFHEVVHSAARGWPNIKFLKEEVEKLFLQNKDPNQLDNYRTAAQLSVYYYVNFAGSSENQFDILRSLLDSPKNMEHNKKRILDDLDDITQRLALSQSGFKEGPFKRTKVSGGGSFIDDEGEDEGQAKDKKNRISRVKELLEELKN